MKKLLPLLVLVLCPHGAEARTKQRSTITLDRSDSLSTQPVKPGKSRSFKRDVAAVTKSHSAWRAAHLNANLYACQHNAERVALLARRVADKVEAAKNGAVKEAKAVEKVLAQTLGTKAEEPNLNQAISPTEATQLRAKIKLIESAQQRGETLERLARQVSDFYRKDIPQNSAFPGECQPKYSAALRRGQSTSQQYHADTQALGEKLTGLARLAHAALLERERLFLLSLR